MLLLRPVIRLSEIRQRWPLRYIRSLLCGAHLGTHRQLEPTVVQIISVLQPCESFCILGIYSVQVDRGEADGGFSCCIRIRHLDHLVAWFRYAATWLRLRWFSCQVRRLDTLVLRDRWEVKATVARVYLLSLPQLLTVVLCGAILIIFREQVRHEVKRTKAFL